MKQRWQLAYQEDRVRLEINWRLDTGMRSALLAERGMSIQVTDDDFVSVSIPSSYPLEFDPVIELEQMRGDAVDPWEEVSGDVCRRLVLGMASRCRKKRQQLVEPRVILIHGRQQVTITEPELGSVNDVRRVGQVGVSYVAGQDAMRFSNWRVVDLPDPLPVDVDSLADQLVDDALTIVDTHNRSRPITGKHVVVLGPGGPAALIHEIAHLLEADQPGAARLVGKKIGNGALTIIDDPGLDGYAGSMKFDDEGTRTRPTTLVNGGVVEGLVHTRRTAGEMNVRPTGNARRQSFQHIPLARMTNTYLVPGNMSPTDLIRYVNRGVYVTDVMTCLVNPRTGHVHVAFAEAYLIEDGVVTDQPVSGRINYPSPWPITARIVDVANDLAIVGGRGLCGKLEQKVPVACGQGTVLLDDITIT